MYETSKHLPKTVKRCFVFKDNFLGLFSNSGYKTEQCMKKRKCQTLFNIYVAH